MQGEIDDHRPHLTIAMSLGLLSLVLLLIIGIWLLVDTHSFSNQSVLAPDVVDASPSPNMVQ